MNAFGFIDYKAPLHLHNDMRTSTYRGHRYMNDIVLDSDIKVKFRERKTYEDDPVLAKLRVSDYKTNYTWQFPNPDEVRNPAVGVKKIHFMKSFEERKLRFISRPMRPASSVSQTDYQWHPIPKQAPPESIPMQSAVRSSKLVINRASTGYSKYLDPSATTSRLDFVGYTPDELKRSIAAHDNITFWNWDKIKTPSNRVFPGRDERMCDEMAANECPKRHCEFTSLVSHVPNSGLTTEVRENYIEPHRHSINFDTSDLKNCNTHFEIIPFPDKTEYKVYGSGDQVRKYV